MTYRDRKHAGEVLANLLTEFANRPDVIVIALPRGGVPVAYEIASKLSIPLDIIIVRKLGLPGNEEFAMGAIGTGGIVVVNGQVERLMKRRDEAVAKVIQLEKQELERREAMYRANKPIPDLTKKTVILVDDGIATGSTMTAAIEVIKAQHAAQIIIAVPVGAEDTCRSLRPKVSQLICPLRPVHFMAVGLWYENFTQTTDEEVISILRK